MIHHRLVSTIALVSGLLIVLAVISCASEDAEWQEASSNPSIERVEHFLATYPNGNHRDEAQQLLDSLVETRDWIVAQEGQTTLGFNRFLDTHPTGYFAAAARDSLSAREADAWADAAQSGTAASYEAFLSEFPDGERAEEARDSILIRQQRAAWLAAVSENTADSFAQFVAQHPNAPEAEEARFASRVLERATGFSNRREYLAGIADYEPAADRMVFIVIDPITVGRVRLNKLSRTSWQPMSQVVHDPGALEAAVQEARDNGWAGTNVRIYAGIDAQGNWGIIAVRPGKEQSVYASR